MSEIALKMAEALRPQRGGGGGAHPGGAHGSPSAGYGSSSGAAGGGPEVSQTDTPSSANRPSSGGGGRTSFSSLDAVSAQANMHAIRAKRTGSVEGLFHASVPAAVAQNTRWDNMATELRRACATMRDGLTQSLRDVEERQRVLEAAIPVVEGELKEVRYKGNESLEYAEKFFEQLMAQVAAKKVQVMTELKEQVSAKEWNLEQQLVGMKQHLDYLNDAHGEGARVASIESELTLLECAGRTESLMSTAVTREVPALEPAAKAVFTSEIMPASSHMAIKAVPEFLTESVVDWVAVGKDKDFQDKIKYLPSASPKSWS
ncbi:hypothetical protein RI054_40g147560 [Pseudoscourfieldia marina]